MCHLSYAALLLHSPLNTTANFTHRLFKNSKYNNAFSIDDIKSNCDLDQCFGFSFFIHQECVCYLNVPSLHSPLFGLNLNLSFSNLISSGVNFFDNLRKKTPSTPSHSSATDSSPRYDYPMTSLC